MQGNSPEPPKRINCRRRKVETCLDGKFAIEFYEGGDPSVDGTYDPETETVICDACYVGF